MHDNTRHIHWFRNDLRLLDNPALHLAQDAEVLALYILDPAELSQMGEASKVWLCQSLDALNTSLNGRLCIQSGVPAKVLPKLLGDYQASHVSWTRRYDPQGMATDIALKSLLAEQGVQAKSVNGSLLWEPWQVHKPDGTPYRVFTPFFQRGCQHAPEPRIPLPKAACQWLTPETRNADHHELLMPKQSWPQQVLAGWTPGEIGAQAQWESFIDDGLADYKQGRDFPAKTATSRVAPHLRFGEVSPNQLWYALGPSTINSQHYRRELAWREFSYHLLYQHPDLIAENLNPKFNEFPWQNDGCSLTRWQTGTTGIPIVDAGMRELWQTGYMHNRVRMIVASFLVKNLMMDWREGAAWFQDTLFDHDIANNTASWQWVAGCGADAAPYFRIFNPVTQGKKFDGTGVYTRRYLPELAALPDKHLFAPWEAPAHVLEQAKVTLGETYPHPIVDLKESRLRALDAFASLPKIR